MKKYFYLLSTLSLLNISCSKDSPDDLKVPTLPETVTYDADIKPIMTNNCISCHGNSLAEAGLKLTTYAEVKDAIQNKGLINRISRSATDPLVMPKNNKMAQSNIDLIVKWQTDGLLEK